MTPLDPALVKFVACAIAKAARPTGDVNALWPNAEHPKAAPHWAWHVGAAEAAIRAAEEFSVKATALG